MNNKQLSELEEIADEVKGIAGFLFMLSELVDCNEGIPSKYIPSVF